MKTFQLKYGNGHKDITVADTAIRLDFKEPDQEMSKEKFLSGLARLFGSTSPGKVAIVVADKTRLCGYRLILPWLTEFLESKGCDPGQLMFFIGYGTHSRQSDDECRGAYGEVYDRYRFIHHDCHDSSVFRQLGTTRRGTPVLVRRELCEADMIITVGAISHHYFAGYGGGRKLIFPGLGEREAVYTNHRLYLDSERCCLATGCQPGALQANPLAEDLREVHELLPPYLSIHGILDSSGTLAQLSFGSTYEDFLKVCERLDRYYKVSVSQPFDLVIASSGGFPKDINFIQTHKSIHHAAALVRDGGTLIVFAECRDGIGSKTFLPYFSMGGWDGAFRHLAREYAGNGGTALAMMEKTRRIRIKLVTSLEHELCRQIGVERIDAAEANTVIGSTQGSIAVIENSSLLIGSIEKSAD